MKTYAVVSTYYKHGEYKLDIFYSEEDLRKFLISQYVIYLYYSYEEDVCNDMDTKDLIIKVCEKGEEMVNNQIGWGVREVREIGRTR
jgi:hypothetical protein